MKIATENRVPKMPPVAGRRTQTNATLTPQRRARIIKSSSEISTRGSAVMTAIGTGRKLLASLTLLLGSSLVQAADIIPPAQQKPPGPALSPIEAIAKMTVPPGFKVELVASEPDIVNPVAMTFDERGRVWITESLEYPRH